MLRYITITATPPHHSTARICTMRLPSLDPTIYPSIASTIIFPHPPHPTPKPSNLLTFARIYTISTAHTRTHNSGITRCRLRAVKISIVLTPGMPCSMLTWKTRRCHSWKRSCVRADSWASVAVARKASDKGQKRGGDGGGGDDWDIFDRGCRVSWVGG
jgi:hypothetical protein